MAIGKRGEACRLGLWFHCFPYHPDSIAHTTDIILSICVHVLNHHARRGGWQPLGHEILSNSVGPTVGNAQLGLPPS